MNTNKIQFQKGSRLLDFLKEYGTEERCFEALVKLQWIKGFESPKCRYEAHCRLTNRKLFHYNACRSQASITSGTIYHLTRIPLTEWFLATHLITQSKRGIPQFEVLSDTGSTVYYKLAQVMMEKCFQKPLLGNVEINYTYWGGKNNGKRGRSSENKMSFVATIEENTDNHLIHIKLSVISGFKNNEMKPWSKKYLALGTVDIYEGLHCSTSLKGAGFSCKDPEKSARINWVNVILRNLESALLGIHNKLSSAHFPRHLAAFQYRFNGRFVRRHE